MTNPARSLRATARHSRLDAEAYDEFSKMMTPMCRFVKPMLSMVPPDPTTLNPKDLKQLHFLLQRFRELSSDERYTLVQLMTMSSADFLDQWFETDVLKATMSASGIIGTFLGIRSPGTAYVLLHHYMGEIDGAFRSWAFSRGGTGAHLRGAIYISPSMEYMERAYDDAKYGRYSRRPYIDMVIPSLTDPSVAPPGKHVLSCFVQYAPYKLAEGNWDDQKEAFGDNVINTIAEYAPNIRDIIIGRQILTPLDLEREFGLTQGNIFQGELSLEQLFFLRPVAGCAYYPTPSQTLHMAASATHPRGGIMAANARLASQVLLKEWPLASRAPCPTSTSSAA